MTEQAKGKLAIMAAAFVLFAAGVAALSADRGLVRTAVLWAVVGAMLLLAAWVTAKRMRKPKR